MRNDRNGIEEVIYAPLYRFVLLLAKGWRLPDVVEPMAGHHGAFAILLSRPVVMAGRNFCLPDHSASGAMR